MLTEELLVILKLASTDAEIKIWDSQEGGFVVVSRVRINPTTGAVEMW